MESDFLAEEGGSPAWREWSLDSARRVTGYLDNLHDDISWQVTSHFPSHPEGLLNRPITVGKADESPINGSKGSKRQLMTGEAVPQTLCIPIYRNSLGNPARSPAFVHKSPILLSGSMASAIDGAIGETVVTAVGGSRFQVSVCRLGKVAAYSAKLDHVVLDLHCKPIPY